MAPRGKSWLSVWLPWQQFSIGGNVQYLADTPAGQVCPGCNAEVHTTVCSLLSQGNSERVCRRVEKNTGRWQDVCKSVSRERKVVTFQV